MAPTRGRERRPHHADNYRTHAHNRTVVGTMLSYLLHLLLHYTRLCWNFICSLLRGDAGEGGSGGVQLSSLFGSIFGGDGGLRLTFDNGAQVEVGRQIAEGGFSYVFEAFPVDQNGRLISRDSSSTLMSADSGGGAADDDRRGSKKKYALKRINCRDHELVQACRREAGVHRALTPDHPNLMELLGLKFATNGDNTASPSSQHNEYDVCYMLFPFLPHSLRGEINERNILGHLDSEHGQMGNDRRPRPFATEEVLRLLGGLVDALTAMHDANLSHRDVKPENVLLRRDGERDTPVLMDFGSAGPLTTGPLASRRLVSSVVEEASSNTTLPYRPPELFEGGLRHGPGEVLDYGRVDVWSLGCVLFGMMHGTSPFEMEFSQLDGHPRVVECTHLKVLGEVPLPLRETTGGGCAGDGRDGRYPPQLYDLVRCMVRHDRTARPDVRVVARRLGELHVELMGQRWISYEERRRSSRRDEGGKRDYDDFDSLIATRDFV